MFKLTHSLPERYWVACSGGVDSMAALHFLSRPSSRKRLCGVAHINHGTGEYADKAQKFVEDYCQDNKIFFLTATVTSAPLSGDSPEDFWRTARYSVLKSVPNEWPVVLGHNFDDCVEEYLMCTLVRGYTGTIAYQYKNCVRPFRLWKRKDIEGYVERNNIPYIEDPSNADTRFKRNFIRHEIAPKALELNPGLYKIVRQLMYKQERKE